MEPIAPYEQTGFFGNVVFTNGHVVRGDEVTVYYGASDEVICGFGRLGTSFGCSALEFAADSITIAKAVTSAYVPLAGLTVE